MVPSSDQKGDGQGMTPKKGGATTVMAMLVELNPMKTIVIGTINHSEIGVV